MSQILDKTQVRQNTIDVISVLPELVGYTVYNSPMSSIPLDRAPYITVYFRSENGNNDYDHNPVFITNYELVISIVYKQGSRDGFQDEWASALEEAETAILNALFTNESWLSQFTTVTSYDIQRIQDSDGESYLSISDIVLIASQVNTYTVNRL